MNRKSVAKPTPYPGSGPAPRLPDGAACASPLHAEHRDWWLVDDLHTAEGLAQAQAAAAVCISDCVVFDACHDLAHDIRPSRGIWAGEAWVGGRASNHGRLAEKGLL